jgi:6-pyruvoyl-tetrahydropterin synthase related domain
MLTLDETPLPAAEPVGDPAPFVAVGPKTAWFDNPQNWVDLLIVVAAVACVAMPMHPELWFVRTTPTGGDFGAHVWGPAYLRDHLLPKGRISGWTPDWYAGFPAYTFYMVLPGIAVVVLDVLLPYGVALKLVSAIGPVTMPISAYLFARMAGLSRPLAPLFAVATAFFVLDEHFTIYGGNLASTMAGEFSFSISLSAALVYFGALICALQTGRRRGLAAVMLAVVVLCHLIVAIYVVVASIILFIVYSDKVRTIIAVQIGAIGALLTMFWVLPFWSSKNFMTNMRYEQRPVKGVPTESGLTDSFAQMLFPMPLRADVVLGVLALVGVFGSIVRRRRVGIALGVLVLGFMGWILKWEDYFPTSHLWNARLLPFMYLCRYLLAAIGLFDLTSWFRDRRPRVGYAQSLVIGGSVVAMLALAWQESYPKISEAIYRQYGPVATVDGKTKHRSPFADGWARWNYSGYERKPAYGEYRGVMSTMQSIGADPKYGCGRAMWETDYNGRYGSTMAMMLLPFWTDSCIGSMEGLFFEASGTTPFHFLTVHTMSEKPSGPVRQLNYEPLDLDKGTEYLQTLGVRYYMAFSPKVVAKADVTPGLTPIATSGPWHVYEVAQTPVVQGLDALPVVVNGIGSRDRWEAVAQDWFQDATRRRVAEAADGPDDWPRTNATFSRRKGDEATPRKKLEAVTLAPVPTATDVTRATVTNVELGDDSIEFDVDSIGTPVLVKVSYFPNWKANGADGPWRVAPNFMVVVPRSTHVTLTYERSRPELMGIGLSAIGLVGLLLLVRRTRRLDDDLVEVAQYPPLWANMGRRTAHSDEPDELADGGVDRDVDSSDVVPGLMGHGDDRWPAQPGTITEQHEQWSSPADSDLEQWGAPAGAGVVDSGNTPAVLVDWEDSVEPPRWDEPGSSRLRR